MTLEPDNLSFTQTRGAVARVLLEHAADSSSGKPGLAQRDIALKTGTDWYTVHMSLKSIRDEGAIRIDRNRIIVNRQALQRLAAEA
ncbi:MAG: helix-turn-helix domain-containing protein [Dehalococcoidales bacterium]|jgi:DNA-binding MarR family transcriptional regulator